MLRETSYASCSAAMCWSRQRCLQCHLRWIAAKTGVDETPVASWERARRVPTCLVATLVSPTHEASTRVKAEGSVQEWTLPLSSGKAQTKVLSLAARASQVHSIFTVAHRRHQPSFLLDVVFLHETGGVAALFVEALE